MSVEISTLILEDKKITKEFILNELLPLANQWFSEHNIKLGIEEFISDANEILSRSDKITESEINLIADRFQEIMSNKIMPLDEDIQAIKKKVDIAKGKRKEELLLNNHLKYGMAVKYQKSKSAIANKIQSLKSKAAQFVINAYNITDQPTNKEYRPKLDIDNEFYNKTFEIIKKLSIDIEKAYDQATYDLNVGEEKSTVNLVDHYEMLSLIKPIANDLLKVDKELYDLISNKIKTLEHHDMFSGDPSAGRNARFPWKFPTAKINDLFSDEVERQWAKQVAESDTAYQVIKPIIHLQKSEIQKIFTEQFSKLLSMIMNISKDEAIKMLYGSYFEGPKDEEYEYSSSGLINNPKLINLKHITTFGQEIVDIIKMIINIHKTFFEEFDKKTIGWKDAKGNKFYGIYNKLDNINDYIGADLTYNSIKRILVKESQLTSGMIDTLGGKELNNISKIVDNAIEELHTLQVNDEYINAIKHICQPKQYKKLKSITDIDPIVNYYNKTWVKANPAENRNTYNVLDIVIADAKGGVEIISMDNEGPFNDAGLIESDVITNIGDKNDPQYHMTKNNISTLNGEAFVDLISKLVGQTIYVRITRKHVPPIRKTFKVSIPSATIEDDTMSTPNTNAIVKDLLTIYDKPDLFNQYVRRLIPNIINGQLNLSNIVMSLQNLSKGMQQSIMAANIITTILNKIMSHHGLQNMDQFKTFKLLASLIGSGNGERNRLLALDFLVNPSMHKQIRSIAKYDVILKDIVDVLLKTAASTNDEDVMTQIVQYITNVPSVSSFKINLLDLDVDVNPELDQINLLTKFGMSPMDDVLTYIKQVYKDATGKDIKLSMENIVAMYAKSVRKIIPNATDEEIYKIALQDAFNKNIKAIRPIDKRLSDIFLHKIFNKNIEANKTNVLDQLRKCASLVNISQTWHIGLPNVTMDMLNDAYRKFNDLVSELYQFYISSDIDKNAALKLVQSNIAKLSPSNLCRGLAQKIQHIKINHILADKSMRDENKILNDIKRIIDEIELLQSKLIYKDVGKDYEKEYEHVVELAAKNMPDEFPFVAKIGDGKINITNSDQNLKHVNITISVPGISHDYILDAILQHLYPTNKDKKIKFQSTDKGYDTELYLTNDEYIRLVDGFKSSSKAKGNITRYGIIIGSILEKLKDKALNINTDMFDIPIGTLTRKSRDLMAGELAVKPTQKPKIKHVGMAHKDLLNKLKESLPENDPRLDEIEDLLRDGYNPEEISLLLKSPEIEPERIMS